jgi:hypothetical protein
VPFPRISSSKKLDPANQPPSVTVGCCSGVALNHTWTASRYPSPATSAPDIPHKLDRHGKEHGTLLWVRNRAAEVGEAMLVGSLHGWFSQPGCLGC